LAKMGETRKAITYTEKTIEIKEHIVHKEKIDISVSYNNLAVLYEESGDYDKALTSYFKALKINEKVFGKGHRVTHGNYANIALLYYTMKKFDEARKYAAMAKKEPETMTLAPIIVN
ncbi:MAG TPA: tetratricopeptide repeat protein, partial [Campylobacterales bacterium]|nr:tetratricopeptide repeat protein [Campylobacterales bacterium]